MPNRYVCSVLDEMRACAKTQNYSYLSGLIEEVQTLVNRMEAGLEDKQDCKVFREQRSKLRDEIKELKENKKKLQEECGEKTEPSSRWD